MDTSAPSAKRSAPDDAVPDDREAVAKKTRVSSPDRSAAVQPGLDHGAAIPAQTYMKAPPINLAPAGAPATTQANPTPMTGVASSAPAAQGAVTPTKANDIAGPSTAAENQAPREAKAAPEEKPSTETPTPSRKIVWTPNVDKPVTLAYRTFANGNECRQYYIHLLQRHPKGRNMNKYEHEMILDLLLKGHPDPTRKAGAGIKAFQVRELELRSTKSTCFYIVRVDGTLEDFSTRKCIAKLFPIHAAANASKLPGPGEGGFHDSRGGGRSRGGFRGRARGRDGGARGRGEGGRGRGPGFRGRGGGFRGRDGGRAMRGMPLRGR